jgi:two-component system nitrate/nitrite response regulator NarL
MGRNAMAPPVTVAIVDDHPMVIEGLRSCIGRDPGRRVAVRCSGDDLDDVLAGEGADADVLLLDLNLHGRMIIDRIAGLTAAGRRVVVYSQYEEPDIVTKVFDAGAGFVAKDETPDHCVEAIVAAAGDRPYVTPTGAGAILADDAQAPRLSKREQEALRLWFQGMSKASVGRRMGVSESSVKQYISRARVKYEAQGRQVATQSAMLARAIEDGLISADEVGEYSSQAAAKVERRDE